jgi:hypothetical protein
MTEKTEHRNVMSGPGSDHFASQAVATVDIHKSVTHPYRGDDLRRGFFMTNTPKHAGSATAVTTMPRRPRFALQTPKRRKPTIFSFKRKELTFPPAEINIKKLQAQGGVNLHDSEETAKFLIDLVKDYFNDRKLPSSETRRLCRAAKKSSLLAPSADRLRARRALTALIKTTEEELLQHDPTYGLKAGTGTNSEAEGGHDGRLIFLLEELFRQARIPRAMWPSRKTVQGARIDAKQMRWFWERHA